jgi:hypothetical protein
MRPHVRCLGTVAALSGCLVAVVPGIADEPAVPPPRPVMKQLPAAAARETPPSARQLVDARSEVRRRFREPLSHAETAAGASLAAEALIAAATDEQDRSLKWALLEEARRLGVAAGNAGVVASATTLASAVYEFDAIDVELRALRDIPLRGLSPPRAAAVAEAAERLATRAEADDRREDAVAAQLLAIRAWQRAGAPEAVRRAVIRHDQIELDRVRGEAGRRVEKP